MLLRKLLGGLIRAAPRPPAPGPAEPQRIALVLMRSSIGRHLEVFREVMELVAAGLSQNGHATITLVNEFAPPHRHLVFCPHLLRAEDAARVPPESILYNFEPLDPPVFDSVGTFLTHYAPRFRVWDYSAANAEYLRSRGCAAQHVPLGYADTWSRIAPAPVEDIDVLFYGDVSERRARVLDALRETGLEVVVASDVYGAERDALIARAKMILNIHNHDGIKALETPRIFYLLANRKAVVTEAKPGVQIDDDLCRAMVLAPYERLADACVELAGDPGRRAALGAAGLRAMKARDEAAILADALRGAS